MVKVFTLAFFLFSSVAVFGQLPVIYGAQQVFGVATTLGRQVVQADQERKEKARQEELEFEYFNLVAAGDTLYARKEYETAIARYNEALRIRQEQYPRDQIARASAEMARARNDEFRLLIDNADSLYTEMAYDAAIAQYSAALEIRQDFYASEQIVKANEAKSLLGKVHVSGLLITGERIEGITSKAFSNDPYSDFIAPGKYPSTDQKLIYSSYQTIDGISVPAGVRLIVYSEIGYSGQVLLDITGPAIVNNSAKKDSPAGKEFVSGTFPVFLQKTFPASSRSWSASDMQTWGKGSMQVITL